MNFGFNTAVKGLLASQRSLYITNHNIGNVNTKGYSRQEGFQRATFPLELPGTGYLGTGTEIYDIQRIRNSYVDFKYWNEKAPLGEWQVKRENLFEIEKIFGEPSDSSFRQYLDDFFAAMEYMSQNSSDLSYREPVRENGLALTRHINESALRLENLKRDVEQAIDGRVKNINTLANQIASLNRQIYSHETTGRSANDLRDRRDLLLDELSQIVNIKVDEFDNGKLRVSIYGVTLVDHNQVSNIKWTKDDQGNIEILWDNESKVRLRSGELKGLLDLYNGDGEDNSYRGIPYYEKRLNIFTQRFVEVFNEKHREGKRLGGEDGGDFFHIRDEDNPAATVTLHEDILNDLKNIAAGGQDGEGAADDNRKLLELIELREDRSFFHGEGISKGTPDDFLKSIISNLAVDSLQGQRMESSQTIMLRNIETKRESISGVDYDEEMANLVRYQHSYIASARMVTTIDIIMDVTINRLGLVGR